MPRYLTAISQGEFVLAVGLFTAAILVYSHARKLILPVLVMTLSVIAFALVRAWYWPDAFALRVVLEVSYRILAGDCRLPPASVSLGAMGSRSLGA